MSYSITSYSKAKAKKLKVIIKKSTNNKKKIDVFKEVKDKNGKKTLKKIVSIGAIGYKDYPTYLKEDKKLAEKRRKAYKKRHEKDRHVKGSAGFYADQILW
tara:strand:+ start:21298 stop:21600 length:303 start_codon:yes stop_codon:yes gene_type:complete